MSGLDPTGGHPRGLPCPRRKNRLPIFPRRLRGNARAGLGGALITVGLLALVLGIVWYYLSKATGGLVPQDPLMIYGGIGLMAAGCVGILLWAVIKTRMLS